MKYTYNRYWGSFTDSIGKVLGTGYSGHPQYLNDPTKETLVGQGPIPAGEYTITEIIPNDPHTGILTCVLQPAQTNKMYGRSGFRIHGDNLSNIHSASDGCIITPHELRARFAVGDVIVVV